MIDDEELSNRKQQSERFRLTKLIDEMTFKASCYRESCNMLMKQEELLRISIEGARERLGKLESKVKL